MEQTDFIKERKIEISNFDNLGYVFNEIDDISRFKNASGHSQDNVSENFATYYKKIAFYSKDLTEEKIREGFNDSIIKVTWINRKNELIKKEYNISDLLIFK